MNLYKKHTAKSYSLLVIDTSLASGNSLRFRKKLLEIIYKLIKTIDDKVRDKKLQHSIDREAANLSALSSSKIDKSDYLTGEEIVPSDQSRIIEQAKFTYSLLGKTLQI